MVITRAKKKPAEPVSRITKAKKKPAETVAPVARPSRKPAAAKSRAKDVEKQAEKFIDSAEPAPMPVAALPAPASNPAGPSAVAEASSREQQAIVLIKRYVPWTAGAAFIPIPGVDFAAVIGVQMTMLSKLSQHYGVPFKESAAKSSAASLMAILLQGTLAGGFISFARLIPGLGTVATIAALPAFAAAGTYAIGKVFITHFEAGGTFLDFEPKKVEAHFRSEFERARKQGA